MIIDIPIKRWQDSVEYEDNTLDIKWIDTCLKINKY